MFKAQMFDEHGNPIDDDVVPPGGRVTVPMQLRDSLAPGIAGALAEHRPIVDDNLAAGQRQVAAMAYNAATVQRNLDELRGEATARAAMIDRDPRQRAYAQACADLDYQTRGAA